MPGLEALKDFESDVSVVSAIALPDVLIFHESGWKMGKEKQKAAKAPTEIGRFSVAGFFTLHWNERWLQSFSRSTIPTILRQTLKKFIWLMDWLHWHLLDQIATETDQSLLIFSPFCSLVSLLMPAQCLLVCTRILKETWRNICMDWKKTGSRRKAGQNVVVQKSSFKFPSNYWHDTRSMPAIFFAVSNLVQSSRYQAGVIWLQYSQSISEIGEAT